MPGHPFECTWWLSEDTCKIRTPRHLMRIHLSNSIQVGLAHVQKIAQSSIGRFWLVDEFLENYHVYGIAPEGVEMPYTNGAKLAISR